MFSELEKGTMEVFNAEYIVNGYVNLKNLEKMAPMIKDNPLWEMAVEQIKNGLGESNLEGFDF